MRRQCKNRQGDKRYIIPTGQAAWASLLPSFRILFFISSSSCIIRPNKRILAYLLVIKDINSIRAAFPLNIIDQHRNNTLQEKSQEHFIFKWLSLEPLCLCSMAVTNAFFAKNHLKFPSKKGKDSWLTAATTPALEDFSSKVKPGWSQAGPGLPPAVQGSFLFSLTTVSHFVTKG